MCHGAVQEGNLQIRKVILYSRVLLSHLLLANRPVSSVLFFLLSIVGAPTAQGARFPSIPRGGLDITAFGNLRRCGGPRFIGRIFCCSSSRFRGYLRPSGGYVRLWRVFAEGLHSQTTIPGRRLPAKTNRSFLSNATPLVASGPASTTGDLTHSFKDRKTRPSDRQLITCRESELTATAQADPVMARTARRPCSQHRTARSLVRKYTPTRRPARKQLP